jgi:hypothetical protein
MEQAAESADAGADHGHNDMAMKALNIADDEGSALPAMAALLTAVRQRVTVGALALLKDYPAARGLNAFLVLVSYLQVRLRASWSAGVVPAPRAPPRELLQYHHRINLLGLAHARA